MSKRKAAGLLVLYDEGKGIRKPQVQLLNPSPRIEDDVNEWIQARPDLAVQRVDWIPSGGQLGASITYTKGGEPTQSLHIVVPGLEAAEARLRAKAPLEGVARFLLTAGIVLALAGLTLFWIFYPETWYGSSDALGVDPSLAVKTTALSLGLGLILMFAAVSVLLRARVS